MATHKEEKQPEYNERQLAFLAVVDLYTKKNPVKAEAKEAEFAKKLAALA